MGLTSRTTFLGERRLRSRILSRAERKGAPLLLAWARGVGPEKFGAWCWTSSFAIDFIPFLQLLPRPTLRFSGFCRFLTRATAVLLAVESGRWLNGRHAH